ncbi:MAG: YcjX family protein [Acetobacteraceae bacterium]|nr:YcjX family protein [Acetobacteraceae bacterium]
MADLAPGRFLNPDAWEGMAFLLFCPLAVPSRTHRRRRDRSGSGCARTGTSIGAARGPEFLAPHFARFDAQIVLVDLFRALASGAASFADTQAALAAIAAALRPEPGLLARLGLERAPPRPVFCATKADYVPASQRGQLAALLRHLVGGQRRNDCARRRLPAPGTSRSPMIAGRVQDAVEGLGRGGRARGVLVCGRRAGREPGGDRGSIAAMRCRGSFRPHRGRRGACGIVNLDRALAAALPGVFG